MHNLIEARIQRATDDFRLLRVDRAAVGAVEGDLRLEDRVIMIGGTLTFTYGSLMPVTASIGVSSMA